jgi:Holliday junction DNA helicase RuvA
MITALRGTVVQVLGDGRVHLRCGPVALELQMPQIQARELQAGDDAELHTYLHLSTSADQLKLHGFTSGVSRDLFATLITGSGVGPRVALALLELGPGALIAAVRDGDERTLTAAPGVGPKLAKKIIVELSEKVAKEFAAVAEAEGAPPRGEEPAVEDALDAVVALGFPRLKAEQALAHVRREYDGTETATLVRLLLARITSV